MQEKPRRESDRQREATEVSLRQLGNLIYEQIQNREFPWVMMQSRSTDNIIYDPELRQYILGSRTIRRHARNIRH
ncbi:MAG: DNA topoisomerase IV subunit A, partial [Candidatus Bathyarchaeota archaeon]|nr:DNA topoisomerase IV subunit A [Candidatus Bathyarchaeota archaeon]